MHGGGCGNGDLLVRIAAQPPEGERQTPTDVCMVIDISGSMGTEATMMHAGGARETHGLSLLDVVKHGVSAVIDTLTASDRLTLVAYSSTASTVCAGVVMNPAGKARAGQLIKQLKPTGRTNIWDGLETGLEHLRTNGSQDRLAALLLLTDGQPNVVPPRGHLPMLARHQDTHPDFQCVVSTFGFGYNLDSPLLDQLAQAGGGSYCFIPDSGFVGTAFVHAAANLFATAARHVELAIELPKGATVVTEAAELVSGGQACYPTSWGANLPLGSLQFGQEREVLLRIRGIRESGDQWTVSAHLKYQPVGCAATDRREAAAELRLADLVAGCRPAVSVAAFRTQTVDTLRDVIGRMQGNDAAGAKVLLGQAAAAGTQILSAGVLGSDQTAHVTGMIEDLTGQATEAISTQAAWTKWGRHYLPSLARAHQLQQCNNFKDPGVQHYGGDLFRELRDCADAGFLKLLPPTPSCLPQAVAAARAPVDMRMYHNRGGGCLAGGCLASTPGGAAVRVDTLKAGDKVLGRGGAVCTVRCMVETGPAVRQLVAFDGGLRLTGWHPIRMVGASGWQFPAEAAASAASAGKAHLLHVAEAAAAVVWFEEHTGPVYSFVLQNEDGSAASGLVVGGVEAIGLAHGIEDDAVAKHSFFGTAAVEAALAAGDPSGWAAGAVKVAAGHETRRGSERADGAPALVAGFSRMLEAA